MSLKNAGPMQLMGWVLGQHRPTVIKLLLLAVGVAVCEVSIPWFIQEAVDSALTDTSTAAINKIGWSMVGIVAVIYVLHVFLLRAETHVLYEGSHGLRHRLYSTLLLQPLSFFSRRKAGEIQHRVVNDVEAFESNSVYLFSDMPFELLTVVAVLVMMFVTDLQLAGVAVGFLLVASLISAQVGRSLPGLQKDIQSVRAGLSSKLQEALAGVRTIKTFGREQHEINRLDESSREIVRLEGAGGRVQSYLLPIFDLMEILGIVLVVWFGAHLMVAKEITPGNLVAFLAYMEILAGPVSNIEKYYRHWLKFRAVSERIGGFMGDMSDSPPPGKDGGAQTTAHIDFQDVSFAYIENGPATLKNVSFRAEVGDIIALVGRNGAGKSTLLDLLLKFYSPTGGKIVIDGTDLNELDSTRWRKQLGFMSQEIFLIHGSIAENIAYGRPEASLEEIRQAAEQAQLGELLDKLPNGLNTAVGDRGIGLSGGERQRIALARLFLLQPRIVIFDEPTAHLDIEAAQLVTNVIKKLAHGRIAILVSHRPDTLALATRAILLDRGKIVADGTPNELSQARDLFRVLTHEHADGGLRQGQ